MPPPSGRVFPVLPDGFILLLLSPSGAGSWLFYLTLKLPVFCHCVDSLYILLCYIKHSHTNIIHTEHTPQSPHSPLLRPLVLLNSLMHILYSDIKSRHQIWFGCISVAMVNIPNKSNLVKNRLHVTCAS